MTKIVKDVLSADFDDVKIGVRNAAELWAGATGKGVSDALDEQCRRFVNGIKKYAPPTNASRDRTVQFRTIAQHKEWLRKKILVWHHKRGRKRARGNPDAYVSKTEAPRYFEKAVDMEGGLIGNFAPLAELVGARAVPKWMARHGTRWGNFAKKMGSDPAKPEIDTRWTAPANGRFSYFVGRSLNFAEKGLATAAQKIVERAMKKAARSGARKGAAR